MERSIKIKNLHFPDDRLSKDRYYINIAKEVSMRGTCLIKNYGAVIVKNNRIVSTGYNGAPRQCYNCLQIGKCVKSEYRVNLDERDELCRAVHAEANAIIQASAEEMEGATLYLYGREYNSNEPLSKIECCSMCKRLIINSGISMIKSLDEKGLIKTIRIEKLIFDDKNKFK